MTVHATVQCSGVGLSFLHYWPVLNFTGQTLEQEYFEHFQYLFRLYKERLGPGQNNALILCECLSKDISRAIFSSYGDKMKNLTEEQLLKAMSTTCVTKWTLQPQVSELYSKCLASQCRTSLRPWRQCSMKVKCLKSKCILKSCWKNKSRDDYWLGST